MCLNSEHVLQIEGAFVQGLGWVALEEVKWGDAAHRWIKPGNLLTCGPGNYKIPSINDIPFNFNVSLLKVYIYINVTIKSFVTLLASQETYPRCFFLSIRGIQTQRGYIHQKQLVSLLFSWHRRFSLRLKMRSKRLEQRWVLAANGFLWTLLRLRSV